MISNTEIQLLILSSCMRNNIFFYFDLHRKEGLGGTPYIDFRYVPGTVSFSLSPTRTVVVFINHDVHATRKVKALDGD